MHRHARKYSPDDQCRCPCVGVAQGNFGGRRRSEPRPVALLHQQLEVPQRRVGDTLEPQSFLELDPRESQFGDVQSIADEPEHGSFQLLIKGGRVALLKELLRLL